MNKNASRVIKWVLLVIAFIVAYLTLSMMLYWFTGIKLPEPGHNSNSRSILIADPSYDPLKYNYEINSDDLQRFLDQRSYDSPYQPGVFDSINMSVTTAKYLQEKTYDTSVIVDPSSNHSWVYVWTGENRAFAIETAYLFTMTRKSLGEVIGDDWWDSMISPSGINPDFSDLFSKENYKFYYPDQSSLLHVREWNETFLG